ncbi:glycerol-3-phosphate dehydrogenase [Micractinium conductrix]|uniref:Glycerol-3-phosphate dehydrogenase [NAD(+)] n=1 Tax=Micractinium conductrix TaxID=554055 RepID=A0A2P6V977_9CHLO|nr:glycerol-3-phosphate dehydrogenase [Micractinium conductrix]|eukprot:PSC70634.1 glycerol-3-phosphate dehydrogenase [Micractinium conductrix]
MTALQQQEQQQQPLVDLADALAAGDAAAAVAGAALRSQSPPRPAQAALDAAVVSAATADAGLLYPPEERKEIRSSWNSLMRWSRYFRSKEESITERFKLEKVVVFGGGSFGTAMAVSLARQNKDMQVTLLLRDPYLCKDINELHKNTRYLEDFVLPPNVNATTAAAEAIAGAQFAIHAVPVQHTRAFLQSIKELLPPALPIISVSKGIEVTTGQLMSEVIPSVLSKKHPTVYLSGPSFAKEVMRGQPTGIVAASKDKALARSIQRLFASPFMRVNTTTDVIGVEICGSLKNVLAIAAGIVEGLELGPNAMAALVAQGCAEIRWLATKMGAKAATISGLSGLGDIMLTCYGSLSRNRSVGVRLGRGEKLADILASSSQVAEGVATAAVVVNLARKYRVQLPVLTAVAQVLDGHITAKQAVFEIMALPQIEER